MLIKPNFFPGFLNSLQTPSVRGCRSDIHFDCSLSHELVRKSDLIPPVLEITAFTSPRESPKIDVRAAAHITSCYFVSRRIHKPDTVRILLNSV